MPEEPKVRNSHIALHDMEHGSTILLPVGMTIVLEMQGGSALVLVPNTNIANPVRESFASIASALGMANIPAAPPAPKIQMPPVPRIITPGG